ncbi:unnamed protein product [Rhodiola kirilowii]
MEREELYWKQRSRAKWLKFGDRNTSFFHAKASQRRKRNHIERLRNQLGGYCDSDEGMAAIVTNYFTNIFQSQVDTQGGDWTGAFDQIPRLVSEEMNDKLVAPFTEGEVKRALFQMHPTKAPGLDGFSAAFFQNNWQIVGRDVTREALGFLNHGRLDTRLNETVIALIPKVKVAERVEDLRPISLCNVIMKIITKALANRLKEVLPNIISQNQSAFIGGRLITDNILVAHEVSHFIQGIHKQKFGYISMKLDMSKAYDRVEWHFLRKMMAAMGFAQDWIRKIMGCVETVSYKVRINGNITEEIRPSRGLRQGDPISPYLFLICADWLTHTMGRYQEEGLIKGIRVCRGAPTITHLMFADDCLIFLKARKESLDQVMHILQKYEAVAGQKVNLEKSEVVCSKNIVEEYREQITGRMGMKLVVSHSAYLGLPITFSNRKTELFKSIEERILRKIGDWKHRLLSSAGREVLIKSVLQAIPNYAMSCFKLPVTLCRKLVKGFMRFWWLRDKAKGIHWVKRDILLREKSEGGLGFRKMELMNLALLAKQGWRIMSEPDLMVSKVLKAKYFPDSTLLEASSGSRPSYAWRGIMEAMGIIRHGAEWDAGEGKYCWRRDGAGHLTVKGAYFCAVEIDKLRNPVEGEQSDSKESEKFWKKFWKLKVPEKIKTFGWRLFHDSLPVMESLERRGCDVENRCAHCGHRREKAIHLFKECWWMRSLLEDCNLPATVWENQCRDPGYWLWICAKVCSESEFVSFLCGLWMGWKNRNELVHGKVGRSLSDLKTKLQFFLMEIRSGYQRKILCSAELEEAKDMPIVMCDDSFDLETRKGGWGAVLSQDKMVIAVQAGWLENLGSCFEAECRALQYGLELAVQNHLKKAFFVSDSTDVVRAVSTGAWGPDMPSLGIKECIKILDAHPDWSVVCEAREKNMAADWLAKKASTERWEWSCSEAIPLFCPGLLCL